MHTHRAVKTGLYHLKIAIPTSGGGAPLKLGVPLQTEIIGGPNTKGAWIDAPRVWKALGAMIPSPEISFIFYFEIGAHYEVSLSELISP